MRDFHHESRPPGSSPFFLQALYHGAHSGNVRCLSPASDNPSSRAPSGDGPSPPEQAAKCCCCIIFAASVRLGGGRTPAKALCRLRPLSPRGGHGRDDADPHRIALLLFLDASGGRQREEVNRNRFMGFIHCSRFYGSTVVVQICERIQPV